MWEAFRSYFIFSHLCRTFRGQRPSKCLLQKLSHFYQQSGHTLCIFYLHCTQVRQTVTISSVCWKEWWVIWTQWGSSFPTCWWFQCGHDPAPTEKIWARICCNFPKFSVFHGQYWLHELAETDFSSLGITQPRNCLHHTVWLAQWKRLIVKAFTLYSSPGGVDWEKEMGFQETGLRAHFFPSHLERFW